MSFDKIPRDRPLLPSDVDILDSPTERQRMEAYIQEHIPEVARNPEISVLSTISISVLRRFPPGTVVLAPGDSPAKIVQLIELLYATGRTDPANPGLKEYAFVVDNTLIRKYLRFISFPLSGLGGKKAKTGNEIDKVGKYVRQVLDENYFQHGGKYPHRWGYLDRISHGGTKATLSAALHRTYGMTNWTVFDLCQFQNRDSMVISYYLNKAEELEMRTMASFKILTDKEHTESPYHPDIYRSNIMLLWTIYQIAQQQKILALRGWVIEIDKREHMVVRVELPYLHTILVGQGSTKIRKISIFHESYRSYRKVWYPPQHGREIFCDDYVRCSYSWGDTFHWQYPRCTDWIQSISPSVYSLGDSAIIERIRSLQGNIVTVTYFDTVTQELTASEGLLKTGENITWVQLEIRSTKPYLVTERIRIPPKFIWEINYLSVAPPALSIPKRKRSVRITYFDGKQKIVQSSVVQKTTLLWSWDYQKDDIEEQACEGDYVRVTYGEPDNTSVSNFIKGPYNTYFPESRMIYDSYTNPEACVLSNIIDIQVLQPFREPEWTEQEITVTCDGKVYSDIWKVRKKVAIGRKSRKLVHLAYLLLQEQGRSE